MGPSQTHHNLYPLQARLLRGAPLRVVAERVELRGHTLRWLVSRIDQSRSYFLLGEVEIPDGRGPALAGRLDSVETYNPALYRGGILRLHDARAPELGPWLDQVAMRGAGVAPFWLKPGAAAVTLDWRAFSADWPASARRSEPEVVAPGVLYPGNPAPKWRRKALRAPGSRRAPDRWPASPR